MAWDHLPVIRAGIGASSSSKIVFLNPVANFCADPAERMVLFNNHNAMRLCDGIKNRLLVERFNRAQINNLSGNIFLFELSRDFQRDRNRSARNKRPVTSLPSRFTSALPSGISSSSSGGSTIPFEL
jgi:hypothetical protein